MNLPTLCVLIFGAVLWAIWRSGEIRGFQVLCGVLLGFFLASSVIAPAVTDAVQTCLDWISTWSIT